MNFNTTKTLKSSLTVTGSCVCWTGFSSVVISEASFAALQTQTQLSQHRRLENRCFSTFQISHEIWSLSHRLLIISTVTVSGIDTLHVKTEHRACSCCVRDTHCSETSWGCCEGAASEAQELLLCNSLCEKKKNKTLFIHHFMFIHNVTIEIICFILIKNECTDRHNMNEPDRPQKTTKAIHGWDKQQHLNIKNIFEEAGV